MNKEQFLKILRQELDHLELPAVNEIITDFEEHFASGLSLGKSEEEITADLGDPAEIARQYLESANEGAAVKSSDQTDIYRHKAAAQMPVDADPNKNTANRGKINEAALVTVILMNIFLGIPIWIGLFATLFGCWTAAGGIGVAAIVLFVVAIIQTGVVSTILALFGLSLAALTVLGCILMYFLSKWLVLGLAAYIKWNRKLVMGGQTA